MWTIREKWKTKAGLMAKICFCDFSKIKGVTSADDYWAGYVNVPQNNLLFESSSDLEVSNKIFVHGGVTHAGSISEEEGYWIGFDCAHSGDNLQKCNKQYVTGECETLAEQIIENQLDKLQRFFDFLNSDVDAKEVDTSEMRLEFTIVKNRETKAPFYIDMKGFMESMKGEVCSSLSVPKEVIGESVPTALRNEVIHG